MKMGYKKGKIEIGKWHFKLGFIPIYWRRNGYMFHFGIFKLLSFPSEGETIGRAHYKGFWFRKEFGEWSGFEINL